MPFFHTVSLSEIVKASPWRTTMPRMFQLGTKERTQTLMPIWARQIWFFGPSLCWKACFGSVFSCVPQPISEVVVPSSRKPSMDQVFTNSSTCLGLSVICVSRSEQWMNLHPEFLREEVE